jgi:glycosyltransferase involved in cell wall biosynthesis
MMNVLRKIKDLFSNSSPTDFAAKVVFLGKNTGPLDAVVLVDAFRGTYYHSFWRPLKDSDQVRVAVIDSALAADKKELFRYIAKAQPRCVFLSRFQCDFHQELVEFLESAHIPYSYHIDDDLFQIPAELGAEKMGMHGKPEVIASRRNLASRANFIYASTPFLRERLQAVFPLQKIFNGDIYASFFDLAKLPRSKDVFRLGYMGTKGHQEDLNLALPSVISLMKRFPQLEFEIFGRLDLPDDFKQFGDRVRFLPDIASYEKFIAALNDRAWHVGLAPLVDSDFNRCKAPTKYTEYSSCGIVTVATGIPPYSHVIDADRGVLCENTQWESVLEDLILNPTKVEALANNAQNYCRREFSVEKLRNQVHGFVKRLVQH